MRLRKKPWINEALNEFDAFVLRQPNEEYCGRWQEIFSREAPLHVELGTGKGKFITDMATAMPRVNFVGMEVQPDVLYYAARKVADQGLKNVRLAIFDINNIAAVFAPGEVDRFYINFCDPWPKSRHAKRRLTDRRFLAMYRQLLSSQGMIYFKTDNRALFDFSLAEFTEQGWALEEVTFDLHNSEYVHGNVMTEYELKFSPHGPICRLKAEKL